MPYRIWTERIRDILDAITEIQTFTRDMTFDTFRADRKTIRAVELNFIIIGEAVNHIANDVQIAHPGVPWHLMRAMRNRLVHVYFSIDAQIIWETIENDLPSLVEPLKNLLPKEDP